MTWEDGIFKIELIDGHLFITNRELGYKFEVLPDWQIGFVLERLPSDVVQT